MRHHWWCQALMLGWMTMMVVENSRGEVEKFPWGPDTSHEKCMQARAEIIGQVGQRIGGTRPDGSSVDGKLLRVYCEERPDK